MLPIWNLPMKAAEMEKFCKSSPYHPSTVVGGRSPQGTSEQIYSGLFFGGLLTKESSRIIFLCLKSYMHVFRAQQLRCPWQ